MRPSCGRKVRFARIVVSSIVALDGSCRTPIAGLATLTGDVVSLRTLIIRPDGTGGRGTIRRGLADDATRLGADAGAELRATAGSD